jgi:archaellum biogenesis protein FlaJ (TadC family)
VPDVGRVSTQMPFTFSEINISVKFIIYFVVGFLIVSDLVTCLVIGLVRKGEGKSGLKYFLPLAAFSVGLFFIIRVILSNLLLETLVASF